MRRRQSTSVLEGVRLCEEAMDGSVEFIGAVVSPTLSRTERGAALRGSMAARGIPVEEVDDRTIRDIADTESPQGIVAVVEPRGWTLEDMSIGTGARVLVLDAVQDPGNVGTICRTAYGMGASGVVFLPGTARLTNPKVLRAGMGATFHFPVVQSDLDSFCTWLNEESMILWAADSVGNDIRGCTPPERLVLAIGNEGAGVSRTLLDLSERTVSIPLVGPADSLNAGTAAALLLYEVIR
jgi:TrmH family RNA methyltransferase